MIVYTRPEYIVVISCRRKLQFMFNCSIFTSSSVVWEEKDVSVAVSVHSDPMCMLSLPGSELIENARIGILDFVFGL